MSIFTLAKPKLAITLAVFLSSLLGGCAGYQTFDAKVAVAKQNLTTCQLNYRTDPQMRAFGDLLLTDDISEQMLRISDRPDTTEQQVIKKLRSSETYCRRTYAMAIAKAVNNDYALKSSYSITQAVSIGLVEYVKGTDDALKNLHSGSNSFGDFYKARKGSTEKLTRTVKVGSLMASVESTISYQQRRDAADRAMARVRSGMQEHCIGCAFSREKRTGSKGVAASQKSNGILQSQKISGVNKICQYSQSGSANYVTVKAYEACPASGSRMPPSGNGIFKSSYNNGLNKACVYDKLGSKNVITVGLSDSCPR